ncbi:hypothetical protein SAMN04488038_10228 [Solimonas aquatica]|uniref:Tetratricopeptide repeat-containing protein n=1 Tax=Solimonas aquatica TaxID=489703 RepID=A0A1H9BBK8_9GAMM|nr:hypothetical protein [Solimonas aquatica]SEP86344.1 hypothetical protein SAMN04488038_10228 [Solimonas aquatica]
MNPKSLSLTLKAALIAAALGFATSAQAAPQIRPEVGKPLQEAQKLIGDKNYKEALARISAAEQTAGSKISPYETYVIGRMRGVADLGIGDTNGAMAAFEAALKSGQTPDGEKLSSLQTLAQLAYSAKNFPKAIEYIGQYKAAGGNNPQITGLLAQAYYLGGKYPEAAQEIKAQLQKSGQAPSETQLQLLASCALKQNDANGYVEALQLLVSYHPKPSYWLDLIARTAGSKGFSDRLSLDLARLRYASGTLSTAGDYLDAAQLALQAGFPGEADQYVKAGYAKNALGQGSDAPRHARLKALVEKKIAEDQKTLAEGEKAAQKQASGDALVNTGLNYVGYQQYDKGIALIEQGIAKGNLKYANEAKLHLGYAQVLAGQKAKAQATLRGVQGSDGTASVAKLWMIRAR